MRSTRDILKESKTIAIVGLSSKEHKPSYGVARYLQSHGYRIVPVNPNHAGYEILGETVFASLQEAADALATTGLRIDIVDCFRKAEDIPPVAREALAVRAGCLWMQLGIVNQQCADMVAAAGMDVVQDTCIKVEHSMTMMH